ncbi:MAG: class I SAM-dependent methyltransferase [Chlamydiae bacterium]|nr:class I SAM-dependent methyltransferase [Chlamydiota bacterium]
MKKPDSMWDNVASFMQGEKKIVLGKYASYWQIKSPRRMLHHLAYYKFAAKMIGKNKKVLDVGCNEGLGTWLIAKECGFAKGIDFDEDAIKTAKSNFSGDIIDFEANDFLQNTSSNEEWDAIISFDVIEHIYPENSHKFLNLITQNLKPQGLVIIGTPSLISQNFASDISKAGHVNVYSPQRLEDEMRNFFNFVFMFAANDEIVHSGFLQLAHYLIAMGCKKKITQKN